MDKEWLKKIESGEIKQTSKYYFVIRDILIVAAAVSIFLISVFLVSLVFFEVRESGATILPQFGSRGWHVFFAIFPWLPVIIALILTFLLSLVLKQYSFAYRKPLLYLPVTLAAVLLVISAIVGVGPFHRHLKELSRPNGSPKFIIGSVYPKGSLGDDRVTIGKITVSSAKQLQMQNEDEIYFVNISANTQFPFGDDFQTAENIAVIGKRNGDTIDAVAIRRLPTTATNPPPGFFLFRDDR